MLLEEAPPCTASEPMSAFASGLHKGHNEPANEFRVEEPPPFDLGYPLSADRTDLRYIGNPKRMSADALYEQVLLPALRQGQIPPADSEEAFEQEVRSLPLEEVRAWACDVLKENPWPPGFYVPSFKEFVTSDDYLGFFEGPTERQQKAIEDSIGADARAWFVEPRKTSCVVLVYGKGSGKDLVSSWVCAYVAFAVSHMRNPWFHFDMVPGEVLDIVNVAQDEDSARQVFFTKLKNAVLRDCFNGIIENQKKDIQADAVFFKRPVPGERFTRLCLRINSLHSKNEGAEGRNTFFYIMDEADAMRDSKGHGNATKMHNTLTTSNRFGSKQLGFVISYPRAQNGFMMEMLAKCGNRGGKTIEWWGDLAPTWRVLPWKTYRPVIIDGRERWTNDLGFVSNEPDSEMARIFRDDPELFRAMYACEPPAAEGAFFSMPKKIDECIIPYNEPAALVEQTIREDIDPTTGVRYSYVGLSIRNLRFRKGVVYFLGGDAGETEDSFALSISHLVPPAEKGFCSELAWSNPKYRYAKHYKPQALPVDDKNWRPELWKCEHTGEIPVPGKHAFWGVCNPSGRHIQRPVQVGETEDGEPIYKEDHTGAIVYTDVHLPQVVEDLLLEWVPNRAKGMTVDYRNVRDIILQIGAACQLGMCFFDRWNATGLIQDIRAAGIGAENKAFGSAAQLEWYRHFKMLVYNNIVELLPGEDKARGQLRQLQLINGNKIDHPPLGAKDLTDAEALSFWLCCDQKYAPGRIDYGGGVETAIMDVQAAGAAKRLQQGQSIVDSALGGTLVRR